MASIAICDLCIIFILLMLSLHSCEGVCYGDHVEDSVLSPQPIEQQTEQQISQSTYYMCDYKLPKRNAFQPQTLFCPDTGRTICLEAKAYPDSLFFDESENDSEPNFTALNEIPPSPSQALKPNQSKIKIQTNQVIKSESKLEVPRTDEPMKVYQDSLSNPSSPTLTKPARFGIQETSPSTHRQQKKVRTPSRFASTDEMRPSVQFEVTDAIEPASEVPTSDMMVTPRDIPPRSSTRYPVQKKITSSRKVHSKPIPPRQQYTFQLLPISAPMARLLSSIDSGNPLLHENSLSRHVYNPWKPMTTYAQTENAELPPCNKAQNRQQTSRQTFGTKPSNRRNTGQQSSTDTRSPVDSLLQSPLNNVFGTPSENKEEQKESSEEILRYRRNIELLDDEDNERLHTAADTTGPYLDNLPEEVCKTRRMFVSPKAAMNDRSEWRFIVNLADKDSRLRQVIKVDVCTTPNKPCSSQISLPFGYVSRCKQKYIKKKMLALDPDGKGTSAENFFVPSCCVCEIVKDQI